MQLEVRHLRTVVIIAEAGSLSRAAARLGVSQPSLTAQLQRIEESLGGRLFRRSRTGVTVTPFGQFVLTRARAALITFDELLTVEHIDAGLSPIRLGGYATPMLSGLLKRLDEALGTAFTVHTEHSPRLLLDLLAGRRLDAATLIDYPGHELPSVPSVDIRTIGTEPVFIAINSRHPLASRSEVSLADLAGEDWVVSPPDGAGWPEYLLTACQEAGFTPRMAHVMVEVAMVRDLIANHGAISPCLATFGAEADITVRPLAGTPLRVRHLIAWRREGPLAGRGDELWRLATDAHREALAGQPHHAAWLALSGCLHQAD
ncbi:LysR family transcriptional regulator [Nonomuraea montanisoli]|uniref:LysR family transcriptional regulator n=1 Tax=Nonomuraea montanisoli TaxID=2741721 RepID=UPI001F15D12B|nr:LysR substrate-binding domain-containing protein [Nonomuraea montanisoli]